MTHHVAGDVARARFRCGKVARSVPDVQDNLATVRRVAERFSGRFQLVKAGEIARMHMP